MIRRTHVRQAKKRQQIAQKVKGTDVTIRWTDWPNGKPSGGDNTAGGYVAPTQDNPRSTKTAMFKTWVHFIAPAKSGIRIHAEVQVGNVILDVNVPLVRITDAGDTDFSVGDVDTEWAVNANNRLLQQGQQASFESVEIESLEELVFIIGGDEYVQKDIGDDLARSWESIVSNLQMSRAILLRRQT